MLLFSNRIKSKYILLRDSVSGPDSDSDPDSDSVSGSPSQSSSSYIPPPRGPMYRRQPPRRHACSRCVRLKVKCVPLDATSCQRCTRLGHPSCVFPEDVRSSGNNIPRQQPHAQDTSRTAASTPVQNDGIDSIFHDTISLHLTNELLDKYRRHKMPQFPFVVIPHETDVADLRRRSPFLLLCILTASLEHNPEFQATLETLVRKEVARRMIVDIERNMDLLLGLLVHIAWYHYHWRTYHTHMYMLLQMATMMIGDLGLDREESFHLREIPVGDKDPFQGRRETSPSAAGQRAYLGCYHLCSKLSIFRPQLHMRHTKWMDQCAEALAENAEYPTDLQLKNYIHVQSLAYQGQLLFDEGRRLPDRPSKDVWKQLLDHLEKQRSQSKDVWSGLNADEGWSLRIELEATTALVLGQAVRRRQDVFQLEELDQLGALTDSAHNVIDTFLSVPLSVAVHLSPSALATIWYCLLVLSKLMLLFHHERRRDIIVDQKRIHDQAVSIIRKFEKLTVGDDVWASSKKVVGNMLAWVEKTLAARPAAPSSSHPGRTSPPAQSPVSSSRQGEGVNPQVGWPPTCAPGDLASGYQLQPGDELWQQMLDNFTWFEPVAESDFSTGYYNSFN